MRRREELDALLSRYRDRRTQRAHQALTRQPEVLEGPDQCVVIVRPHGDQDLVSLAAADQVEQVLRRQPQTVGR